MRYDLLASPCALLCLLLAGTASAEDARVLLDRAVQAHGGAARLERTKRGHLKGILETRSNVTFETRLEEWFDLPARCKQIVDSDSSGMPTHVEWLFIGKEIWKREGTKRLEHNFSNISLSAEQQRWYAVLVKLCLLREKDAQLTSLPDETRDGHSLAGIRAVHSQISGDYFFDRSTGLLERSKGRWQSPINGEVEDVETIYENYRDIQGIHYPMRFKLSSKSVSSTTSLSSIEFLDKIDESVFDKPQEPATDGTVERPDVRKTSSQPSTASSEKSPENRHRVLILVTMIAGVIVGAVWFIVRASKRGKQELPPS